MFVIVWLLFWGQEIGSDVAIALASEEGRPGSLVTVTDDTMEAVPDAAAVSDDDKMSTELVDAVLFKGVSAYVAADAVKLNGEPEGVKLMEDVRSIAVVWVVVWVV